MVVTSSGTAMGPAAADLFRHEGAEVLADPGELVGPDEPAALIARAGEIDLLVANLDLPASGARVRGSDDVQLLAGSTLTTPSDESRHAHHRHHPGQSAGPTGVTLPMVAPPSTMNSCPVE